MEQTTTSTAAADTSSTATTIGDASAALALADSSFATPAIAPATETPAPAATTQAAAETPAPESVSTEPPKGEPPKWRWQDILANAREASAKEAEERIRKDYEWANGIEASERNGLLTIRAALNGHPQAIAALRGDQHAQSLLRGLIAEQQQAASDAEPEADLQTADGTPVFSAPQLRKWQEWNSRQTSAQIKQQLTQEFQPLAETARELAARKAQERAAAADQQYASDVLAPVKTMPFYEVLGPKLKDALGALQENPPTPQALREFVYTTYSGLLKAHVDSLSKAQEGQVLANLQRQAVAGTTNPATAGAATPKNTLGDARAALEYAHSVAG